MTPRAAGSCVASRGGRLPVLATVAALTLLGGCGGEDVVYERVPGGPPPLTVPQATQEDALPEPDTGAGTNGDDTGATTDPGTDPDATTTDDGTTAPPAGGATGGTGATTPPATGGGTAPPAGGGTAPSTGGQTEPSPGDGAGTTGGGAAGSTGGTGTGGTSQGGTEAPPATGGTESGSVDPSRYDAFCERNLGACTAVAVQ